MYLTAFCHSNHNWISLSKEDAIIYCHEAIKLANNTDLGQLPTDQSFILRNTSSAITIQLILNSAYSCELIEFSNVDTDSEEIECEYTFLFKEVNINAILHDFIANIIPGGGKPIR